MDVLEQLLLDLSDTWLEGRYDDLRRFYDPDVAMLPPGGLEPIVGVDAMIDSYRQFGKVGTLHHFELEDINIVEHRSTAVCHVTFEVDYEIGSGRYRERGVEVYVIDTTQDPPRIVWRTQVSKPREATG